MGIWPPNADGTDVNALDVLKSKSLVRSEKQKYDKATVFSVSCNNEQNSIKLRREKSSLTFFLSFFLFLFLSLSLLLSFILLSFIHNSFVLYLFLSLLIYFCLSCPDHFIHYHNPSHMESPYRLPQGCDCWRLWTPQYVHVPLHCQELSLSELLWAQLSRHEC